MVHTYVHIQVYTCTHALNLPSDLGVLLARVETMTAPFTSI